MFHNSEQKQGLDRARQRIKSGSLLGARGYKQFLAQGPTDTSSVIRNMLTAAMIGSGVQAKPTVVGDANAVTVHKVVLHLGEITIKRSSPGNSTTLRTVTSFLCFTTLSTSRVQAKLTREIDDEFLRMLDNLVHS